MFYHTIHTPTLLLDPARCQANLKRMAEKALANHTHLRPHFKTHQSREIGHWFREAGTSGITVSSVGMARYFMQDGWNDILIAFPVNVRQLTEISEMARKIQLGVLVLDAETIEVLGTTMDAPLSLWVKVDVGTHRTGVNPNDLSAIARIIDTIKKFPDFRFEGFLAHAGHSYKGRSIVEQQRIYDAALSTMLDIKARFISDHPDIKISLGDTPGASMVPHLGAVDELRPGNYIFYDLMQVEIGACTPDDIAVAMACPVVAVHPERRQWVIYGGAIHFSKDHLLQPGGMQLYGVMARDSADTWDAKQIENNPVIISLSQEHGIVQCSDENFHWHKPGDISLWLPVHSCLTADAMGGYTTIDGREMDHYRGHVHPL